MGLLLWLLRLEPKLEKEKDLTDLKEELRNMVEGRIGGVVAAVDGVFGTGTSVIDGIGMSEIVVTLAVRLYRYLCRRRIGT